MRFTSVRKVLRSCLKSETGSPTSVIPFAALMADS
jgi:hypothetical protein